MEKRFELEQADGLRCAQVLVYDAGDLAYWTDQARKTGHLMGFSYHVDENAMGYLDAAHDVYQIFPPNLLESFARTVLVDLKI